MRKYLIFVGVVMAFMCFTLNANAQYHTSQIHREKGYFINNRGMILSDPELIDLVGEDVFFDTVVGARKQYNAGRKLVISGGVGLGVGLAGIIGGAAMVGAAGAYKASDGHVYFDDYELAEAGGITTALGVIAAALGGTALTVGIPLKAIGQSRLNWVENDYNERALRGYSLHIGSAPHGMGLTLTF